MTRIDRSGTARGGRFKKQSRPRILANSREFSRIIFLAAAGPIGQASRKDPRWLYLLADLLQREQRLAAAENLYDRIAQSRPNYEDARYAAGMLAIPMHEPAQAEAHLIAVLQTDPANQ